VIAELACCTARAEDDYVLPIRFFRGEIGAPVSRLFIRPTLALSAKKDHGLIFERDCPERQMTLLG
jgi:hypothetical protein